MVYTEQFAISIALYRPLIKEKISRYPGKFFTRAFLRSTKRLPERELLLSKTGIFISEILKILDSPDYEEKLREYARETLEKIKNRYENVRTLKVSARELKDFEEKLEKIRNEIRNIDEIYPLSIYLDLILEKYCEFLKMDFEMLKKLEKKTYLSLVEEGFKRYPEKIFFFNAPLIALYLVFGGYRRINLLQFARLASIFQSIANILSLGRLGIVKLEKEAEKIPVFVKR